MPKKKEANLNIKTSARWKRRLLVASDVTDKTSSDIVREAVDEKLERLAEINPKLREALEQVAA